MSSLMILRRICLGSICGLVMGLGIRGGRRCSEVSVIVCGEEVGI